MGDKHRVFSHQGVQLFCGGMAAAGQVVVVIARADDPLSRFQIVFLCPLAQPPSNLFHALATGKIGIVHGIGHMGQMAVGIDKGRHQRPPLEIHPLCPLFGHALRRFEVSAEHDLAAAHQESFGVKRLGHGKDRAAIIKNILQFRSLLCWEKP